MNTQTCTCLLLVMIGRCPCENLCFSFIHVDVHTALCRLTWLHLTFWLACAVRTHAVFCPHTHFATVCLGCTGTGSASLTNVHTCTYVYMYNDRMAHVLLQLALVFMCKQLAFKSNHRPPPCFSESEVRGSYLIVEEISSTKWMWRWKRDVRVCYCDYMYSAHCMWPLLPVCTSSCYLHTLYICTCTLYVHVHSTCGWVSSTGQRCLCSE